MKNDETDIKKGKGGANKTDFKTLLGPDKSDSFSMQEGNISDILVADRGSIYLRQDKFDTALNRQTDKGYHLFSTSRLLDDNEAHRSLGLYGKVSIAQFDGRHLPYADNLVNLVVADSLGEVPMDEVMRVLTPLGVAMIGGTKTVKPWPESIDQWTHFLHGPDNNAVAKDTAIDSLQSIQWVAGPMFTRDHDALASLSALVSSKGRLFYILDEGPTSMIHQPAKWSLIARDAFNGLPLWKKPIPKWLTHMYYFRSGPPSLARRLVAVDERVYATLGFEAPVSCLDAGTGDLLQTYTGSEKTEEIVCHGPSAQGSHSCLLQP